MTQPQTQSQAGLIAGPWNVDPLHSQIMVSVRHFSVANLRAKFPKVTGALHVDAENPLRSSFEVEIDARSVTTGHPAQEDFMRSEPWLDAENHPAITFRSSAIEPTDGGFLIKGDLTLKGMTREIVIPADFHGVVSDPWGLRAGFTSQFVVDRTDFGITWNRVFDWGVMAGDELQFTLDIELAFPDESLAQKPMS
jgi:polyisoprenoid-binding protein YceI